MAEFPSVYQNFSVTEPVLTNSEGDDVEMKGKWNSHHFKNDQPIVLELACGGGEYTVGMAKMHPGKNFIGVDIKGARIWKGASASKEANLTNTAFLRIRIEQIALFFAPGEVSEIWITFPDPFLRLSKAKKRLTSPRFINTYRQILKEGGFVNLKTDEPNLYQFTLETLEEDAGTKLIYSENDIYSKPLYTPELEIKTFYEQMHLENQKTIKYVKFTIS